MFPFRDAVGLIVNPRTMSRDRGGGRESLFLLFSCYFSTHKNTGGFHDPSSVDRRA
jgi:hypothetical protein